MDAGTKPRHVTTKLTPPSSYRDATATETSRRRGVPGCASKRAESVGKRWSRAKIYICRTPKRPSDALVRTVPSVLRNQESGEPTEACGDAYTGAALLLYPHT